MELLGALFSPSSKNKIYPPQENFLYFSKYAVLMFKETKISKKFLMFSLQKAIIIFRETEPPPSPPPSQKNKIILDRTEHSYISGKGNPEKLLIFIKVTL